LLLRAAQKIQGMDGGQRENGILSSPVMIHRMVGVTTSLPGCDIPADLQFGWPLACRRHWDCITRPGLRAANALSRFKLCVRHTEPCGQLSLGPTCKKAAQTRRPDMSGPEGVAGSEALSTRARCARPRLPDDGERRLDRCIPCLVVQPNNVRGISWFLGQGRRETVRAADTDGRPRRWPTATLILDSCNPSPSSLVRVSGCTLTITAPVSPPSCSNRWAILRPLTSFPVDIHHIHSPVLLDSP
jgi:hypothetical protein